MTSSITVRIDVRWWVYPYLNTLVWFCQTFGTTPNIGAVAQFIARRGVRMRLV